MELNESGQTAVLVSEFRILPPAHIFQLLSHIEQKEIQIKFTLSALKIFLDHSKHIKKIVFKGAIVYLYLVHNASDRQHNFSEHHHFIDSFDYHRRKFGEKEIERAVGFIAFSEILLKTKI